MTHTEGVLKKFELFGEENEHTLYMEFVGYDGQLYKIGVSAEEFLSKVLKNEKIGVVEFAGIPDSDDTVSIRGVAKGLTLTAKY